MEHHLRSRFAAERKNHSFRGWKGNLSTVEPSIKNAPHIYITNLSVMPALSFMPLFESDYSTHSEAFLVSAPQAARARPRIFAFPVRQYPAEARFISVYFGGKNLIRFDANGTFFLLVVPQEHRVRETDRKHNLLDFHEKIKTIWGILSFCSASWTQ